MKIIIDIPDDFVPEDGDAFEAVRSALEHFEIPSRETLHKHPSHGTA